MALLASAVDFVLDTCNLCASSESKSHSGSTAAGLKGMLLVCYSVMFAVVCYTHDIALVNFRKGWSGCSFLYFLGSAFEFLGLLILCLKVHGTKTVAGISSQSILLVASSLVFRCASTVVYSGYLPVDKSGDYMVQMMDCSSFCCALYLLHAIHRKFVHTYEEEKDAMPIKYIVSSCLVAAFFIHGSLNREFFWDAMWALSLNLEVFQILPQLYMLVKVGGLVETTTAHYVVNTFLGCLFRFGFWMWAIPGKKGMGFYSYGEETGLDITGLYITIAYIIETILHLDFIYYFTKAWIGGSNTVVLPSADTI